LVSVNGPLLEPGNYEKDAPRADHHERSFSAYIIALDREMVS